MGWGASTQNRTSPHVIAGVERETHLWVVVIVPPTHVFLSKEKVSFWL